MNRLLLFANRRLVQYSHKYPTFYNNSFLELLHLYIANCILVNASTKLRGSVHRMECRLKKFVLKTGGSIAPSSLLKKNMIASIRCIIHFLSS